MFMLKMRNKTVEFRVLFLIFCFVHIGQSKYYHKGNNDFGNSVQGNPRHDTRGNKDLKNNQSLRRHMEPGDNVATMDPPVPQADLDTNSPAPEAAADPGLDIEPAPELEDNTENPSDPESTATEAPIAEPDSNPDNNPNLSDPESVTEIDNITEAPAAAEPDSNPEDNQNLSDPESVTEIDNMTESPGSAPDSNPEQNNENPQEVGDSSCWFSVKAKDHFNKMDNIEQKYSDIRDEYQHAVGVDDFDGEMLKTMLKHRGVAERALQNFGGEPSVIPAGMNLGGYCMMRMPQSVLFVHRLKLRNNTRFKMNYLHNDLKNMTVTARLSLNDLHLLGDYERAVTHKTPSTLYYRPTYGDVQFMLKDVEYKMEGRYRLLNDRLNVEHIISELKPKGILMKYSSESEKPINLEEKHIQPYLLSLKNNVDLWLKDYFNDYLTYFGLAGAETNKQFQAYQNEKTVAMNSFADHVVKNVRRRLRQVNASSVAIPTFTLYAINGMELRLRDGAIHGLDTIHRRSVTTGTLEGDVRHANADVGFSNLKVQYKYEAYLRAGLPPLKGHVVLNSDDLKAHMSLGVVRDSDTIDLDVKFKETPIEMPLTIEGPVNRAVGNFKHLLQHNIKSIMINALMHHIHQLGSVARCEPLLPGNDKSNYKDVDQDGSESSEQSEEPNREQPEPEPNDDPTEQPDPDSNDDPTEQPDPDSNDDPTEQPDPDSNDDPTEQPDPDSNDDPTEQPDPDLNDDTSESAKSGSDDGTTPGETDSDNPTSAPESGPEDVTSQPAVDLNPDYKVFKKESAELEMPRGEKYLLKTSENFTLTRINKHRGRD